MKVSPAAQFAALAIIDETSRDYQSLTDEAVKEFIEGVIQAAIDTECTRRSSALRAALGDIVQNIQELLK